MLARKRTAANALLQHAGRNWAVGSNRVKGSLRGFEIEKLRLGPSLNQVWSEMKYVKSWSASKSCVLWLNFISQYPKPNSIEKDSLKVHVWIPLWDGTRQTARTKCGINCWFLVVALFDKGNLNDPFHSSSFQQNYNPWSYPIPR